MLRNIFLAMFKLIAFNVLASDKSIDNGKSPKATLETYVGNHIENLAAHEMVNLSPINNLAELNQLPIWLSEDADSSTPWVYSGKFWEIEPMGEYLYFLAGNFKKNEKGLLRFGTADTSIFVEVNFEDDVIDVAMKDAVNEQEAAENNADSLQFILSQTIGQLSQKTAPSNFPYDDRVAFVSLATLLKEEQKGLARFVFHKSHQGKYVYVTMVYREIRQPLADGEIRRYTKIELRSGLPNMEISSLVEQFLKLVNKYSNMPYVRLSGTTRA